MDYEIDFSKYSLEDLYSSAESIDREAFPERAKEIDALIIEKKKALPESNENSTVVEEQVSRLDRLFAVLIDGLIQIVATIPLVVYFGVEAFSEPTLFITLISFAYGVLTVALLQGYLLYHYGQTIGKNLLSIRIENLDGTKADLKRIVFLRMLPLALINCLPGAGRLFLGVLDAIFIFGKDRRCLHDYIAKTKVSYTDS